MNSDASYDQLVDRLLFIDPRQLDRELSAISDLDPARLDAAFMRVAAGMRADGRSEELALLADVHNATRGLTECDAESPRDDRETLLTEAVNAGGLLAAYWIFRRRRELADEDLFDALEDLMTSASPADRDRVLPTLCALGATIDEARIQCRTRLYWGAALREAGRLRGAERHVRRALVLADQAGESAMRLEAMSAIAMIAEARGDVETAARELADVLAQAERDGNASHATVLRAALARLARQLGRSADALGLLDAALPGYGNLPEALTLRRLRALTLDDLGRYEDGEAEFEKASGIAERLGDDETAFLLRTDAGFSAMKRRDTRTALQRLGALVREAERHADSMRLATACNNFGQALLEAGRAEDAREQFQRAWGLRLERGIEGKSTAISLAGLADAARALGEHELEDGFLKFALMQWLMTGDEEILETVLVRMSADDVDDETLGVIERAASRSSSEVLTTVLADQLARRGHDDESEAVLRDAIARTRSADSTSYTPLRLSLQLAIMLATKPDRHAEARVHLRELVDEVTHRAQTAMLDERRGEIVTDWLDAFATLIELLVDDGSAEGWEEAFAVHEAAKAQGLAATLAAGQLPAPPSVPAELLEHERDLLASRRDLQRPVRAGEPSALANRLVELANVRSALSACWSEIAAYAPEYAALRGNRGRVSSERVRASLATAATTPAAFVSFFCSHHATTIFVIRTDEPDLRSWHTKVARGDVEAAVATMRRAFNGDPNYPPLLPIRRKRPGSRPLPQLDAIGERLLADVADAVTGCELVCLAPHGPLHGLPLHALRLGPEQGVLGDRHAVVYAPSGTGLVYAISRPARAPASATVVGVAARNEDDRDFLECDDVLFAGRMAPQRTVTGLAARKEVVVDVLDNTDVIHVSCHGYFDPRDPMGSGLLLSDGVTRPPNRQRDLSVAQRAAFVLTARELAAVSTDAKLVTLRACSTGIQADRARGDDLDGLTRALIGAGARCVAVTLWNTDKQSSRALLASFYRHWLSATEPQPAWRALWLSQQELRAVEDEPYLNHPYHWAPLVLVGDWR